MQRKGNCAAWTVCRRSASACASYWRNATGEAARNRAPWMTRLGTGLEGDGVGGGALRRHCRFGARLEATLAGVKRTDAV